VTRDPVSLTIDTPEGRRTIATTDAEAAQPLTAVLRHHDLPLNTRCGDRGLCEGCLIELHGGRLIDLDSQQPVDAQGQALRACRYRLDPAGAAQITLPQRSMTRFEAHAVDEFEIELPHAHHPLIGDDAAHITEPVGIAIDVGTTTVALMLVDLTDGRVLARAGAFNRQVDFGDNVLTRINLCLSDAANVAALQAAVAQQTLGPLIEQVLTKAGVSRRRVVTLTAAGNPTMLHLLAGENPGTMGVAPFDAVFLDHRAMPITETGLAWEADAGFVPTLHLLPSAAAYVGSDLTAGIVATAMRYQPRTTLLIDVGTNGEIILQHEGRLLGCATAAGPAFEGGGLTDGTRAGDGAIGHLSLAGNPPAIAVEVIGGGKPVGICGSAYIDLLAEGARTGLLGPTGRLNGSGIAEPEQRDDGVGVCDGRGIVVATGQGKRPIVVRESDIAKLLQAKAAVAAGLLTLLDKANLAPDDVHTVYLAGGFGRHVSVRHAIGCGLLPGFRPEQVKAVGNLALAGAFLTLIDRAMLPEMTAAAEAVHPVELNLEPGFEDRYIDQLMLDPDAG
jgi:uncharacterized 2Fe-2S/4Fe-4S cluster protein (DUF4445 family)